MRIFAALAALGIVQAQAPAGGGQGDNNPGGNDGGDNGNNGGNNGNNGNSGGSAPTKTSPKHPVWDTMKTKLEASQNILTPAADFTLCLAKTAAADKKTCEKASELLLTTWGKVEAEDVTSAAWYQKEAKEPDAAKRKTWATAWTAKAKATPGCLAAAENADAYLKGAYTANPPQKAQVTKWQVAEYTLQADKCMAAMAKAGKKLDVAGAGSNAAYDSVATTYDAKVADAETALTNAKKACDKANVTCEKPSSGSNVWVWVLVILALVLVGFGVWWFQFRNKDPNAI